MSQILFDHMYTADPNHRFLKRLGKCGFRILEGTVRHPGGSVCRFLSFEPAENRGGRSYLEFIHTTAPHKPKRVPGLSFSTATPLEKLHSRISKLSRYKSKFVHRNYDWQKGEDERPPGFKRSPVRAVVIKCKDLKKFVKKHDYDSLESYRGQPAARIVNTSGMWDVLLV